LTDSLGPLQTAIPGMDAMCQAIESYWNIYADSSSKSFSTEAIGLLKEHLPVAVSAPTTIAREKVLRASHLAGKAINITRTTGPHALSYYLTANHHVPHGQAVSFFLPVFFLYNSLVDAANCNDTDGPKKVLTTLRELYSLLNVADATEAAQYLQQFMKKIGMAVRLQELGIDKHDILDPLMNSINEQRFANNPVALNKGVLKELCLKYL
jgi:alcohol dehydrogenase class IV